MFSQTMKTEHFIIPDFASILPKNIEKSISSIKYFKESQYRNLNIVETLKFYTIRYIKQLYNFTDITEGTVIADIGAGFGWLSIAYALATNAKIIAVDPDIERLKAGKKIANVLGVDDRIDWIPGTLGKLPINFKQADIVYCIEVLEHVYKSREAFSDLCRIARDFIILTTPNQWFPVIAHDTQLPFCHWLPIPVRRVYAKIFHKTDRENDNLFWSPVSLSKNMKDFTRVSKWLHYASYKDYLETYPLYLPYGNGIYINHISKGKKFYFDLINKLGESSFLLAPSLAGVYRRK
jgi:2-polyprenyl-3-methyl-5-hydroxy-6-metoxy-1,4-benzoquinol methylase